MDRKRQKESGNALVYVLIAIVLFAALTMTLGRQNNTNETESVDESKAELLATGIINYTSQVKYVLDQMQYTGRATAAESVIDKMDFTLPTDGDFNTPDVTWNFEYKVYHPEGGGLNPKGLALQARDQLDTDPPAGWYLGRFNNVEWTEGSKDDVILVAHQIKKSVCENINEKITGSTAIPNMVGNLPLAEVLIDAELHSGDNEEFNTVDCSNCNDYFSLCISNTAGTQWSFYTIVADQ